MSIRTVVTRGFGAGASIGAVVLRGYFPEAAVVTTPQPVAADLGGALGGPSKAYFGRGAPAHPGGPTRELEELRREAARIEAEEVAAVQEQPAVAVEALAALEERLQGIEAEAEALSVHEAEFDAFLTEMASRIAARRAEMLQRSQLMKFLLLAAAA